METLKLSTKFAIQANIRVFGAVFLRLVYKMRYKCPPVADPEGAQQAAPLWIEFGSPPPFCIRYLENMALIAREH